MLAERDVSTCSDALLAPQFQSVFTRIGESMAWKPGQSGNPGGRPRSGNSLAEVIRRNVDPQKLVEELERIANTSPSDQTRLRAIELLMARGWKAPAQVVEVGPSDPFEDLTNVELSERKREILARIEARKQLTEGEADSNGLERSAARGETYDGNAVSSTHDVARPTRAAEPSGIAVRHIAQGVLLRRHTHTGETEAELVEDDGNTDT